MNFQPEPRAEELNRYEIPLVETSFRRYDRTEPTREAFMKALSSIDAILIRATYHTIQSETTLRDLSMDTAVPQSTGQPRADMVEQCSCPSGHTGLSCEVRHWISVFPYAQD